MDEISRRISEIGIVPVIKLNHPERDAVPLARALREGGVPVARSGPPGRKSPFGRCGRPSPT